MGNSKKWRWSSLWVFITSNGLIWLKIICDEEEKAIIIKKEN